MERLATPNEIERRYGLAATWLEHMRRDTRRLGVQIGPVYRKIRGRVFYRPSDVERWVRFNERVGA